MIILTPMPAERHWVRIAGAQAFITVKGRSRGVTRLEFEYPIPLAYAGHMLDELCERPLVEKTVTRSTSARSAGRSTSSMATTRA